MLSVSVSTACSRITLRIYIVSTYMFGTHGFPVAMLLYSTLTTRPTSRSPTTYLRRTHTSTSQYCSKFESVLCVAASGFRCTLGQNEKMLHSTYIHIYTVILMNRNYDHGVVPRPMNHDDRDRDRGCVFPTHSNLAYSKSSTEFTRLRHHLIPMRR